MRKRVDWNFVGYVVSMIALVVVFKAVSTWFYSRF